MGTILMVVTSTDTLNLTDGTPHPSGYWAEELVVPYERFVAAGYDVRFATVNGVAPTPDEGSLTAQVIGWTRPAGSPDHDEADVAHYRSVIPGITGLAAPADVCAMAPADLADYDGVFISGGHGAMDDMPHNVKLTRLLQGALAAELPMAVVCHGHSALLPMRDAAGQWPLHGYRMTAFSHDEELVTALSGRLPFVLQVELERLGARYEKAPEIWGSCVVRDRSLVTGQNPYSSTALADAFVAMLADR